MKVVNALGRRKSAVARVYVVAGKGNITVNGREINNYFKEDALRYIVNQPFEVTGTAGQFDVKVNVDGGGIKGQAEAIRLGISRALCEVDKEAYRSTLKNPTDSLPAMHAKSRERNLVSLVHVGASSSANVSVSLTIYSMLRSVRKICGSMRGWEFPVATAI